MENINCNKNFLNMKVCYFNCGILKGAFFYFLCLTFFSFGLHAQEKIVEGTVTSPGGEPLLGVNVFQKGTSNGVVTDFDGNFRIELEDGAEILIFSFLGFQTIEEPVQGKSTINVTMQEDTESLDEVVVVGYGSTKRTDITGAVSSVGSEDLEKAVYNNVDDLLQGRSSGVQVTSSSGAPGAPATIRIRGNNSISGSNAPLYVLDGIPVTGTPILNPQDIESMEILKDASATAIYGSRGANGVILISTKRGELGKTEIQLSARTSFSDVIETYEMLNGQQYAEFRNEANQVLGREIPFQNPEQYVGQGYDWQEEILKTGIRNEFGLNVSGGKETVKYFVSGNLVDDEGILEGSDYKRGSLRSNLDVSALDEFLEVNINLNGSHSITNRAITDSRGFPASGGPIFNALTSEPIVPAIDYSGMTGEGYQFYNPFLEVTEKDDRNFITDLFASTTATLNFTDNLSYTFNGGINFTYDNRDIFTPSTVGAGIINNGTASTSSSKRYDYVTSNYLTYEEIFNEKHEFNGTAGIEYSEFNSYFTNAAVSNFGIETLGSDNIGVGIGDPNVGSGRSKSVLKSGFLRLNYSFDNRYLFTATMRADGSSRFAANEKWGYFPSAAIGWRISEEEFLIDHETISNLKLRASYGVTGSQAIAPYQSLASYGTTVYGVGNSPSLAFIPQSVANPNLRWETTNQLNLGLDLGLLNNRISFTGDYFRKVTEDLLQSINIPVQSGFGGALVNFGSIKNEGVEFSINAYPIQTNNFNWNTSFNYTTYKTTVLELGGNEEILGPSLGVNVFENGHIYRPGDEYGLFYGHRAIGLIQESDFDEEGDITIPILRDDDVLGHWKFEDINGDGVINNEDRTVIGNPNPDFVFGWNNDFNYGSFGLNIFIQGSIGNDIYNTIGTVINSGLNVTESYKNQTVDWFQNRWTMENPHNDIRYPSINSYYPVVANYMVEDGSYVRLKNVSMSYDIPFENFGFDLQIFITGTNLVTVTNYSGFDPEVSSLGANSLAPGVDLGAYPRQKSYTAGLRMTF